MTVFFLKPTIQCLVVIGICGPVLAGELAYRAAPEKTIAPEPTVRTGVPPTDPAAMQLAEQQYQAGQYDSALQGFGMVAAMHGHPFAWLRVGNVWHRRGNASLATNAYQRARAAASLSPRHGKLRYRAIMNLALLGLAQASQALNEVGEVDTSTISPVWLSEVRTRLSELQARLPPSLPGLARAVQETRPGKAGDVNRSTVSPGAADKVRPNEALALSKRRMPQSVTIRDIAPE